MFGLGCVFVCVWCMAVHARPRQTKTDVRIFASKRRRTDNMFRYALRHTECDCKLLHTVGRRFVVDKLQSLFTHTIKTPKTEHKTETIFLVSKRTDSFHLIRRIVRRAIGDLFKQLNAKRTKYVFSTVKGRRNTKVRGTFINVAAAIGMYRRNRLDTERAPGVF